MTPAATALASRSEYTWPVDFGKSRRIQQTVSADHFLQTLLSFPQRPVSNGSWSRAREIRFPPREKTLFVNLSSRVYKVSTKGNGEEEEEEEEKKRNKLYAASDSIHWTASVSLRTTIPRRCVSVISNRGHDNRANVLSHSDGRLHSFKNRETWKIREWKIRFLVLGWLNVNWHWMETKRGKCAWLFFLFLLFSFWGRGKNLIDIEILILVEFGSHWRPLVQLELVTLVKFITNY